MTVATPIQPDYNTQTGTGYPLAIDAMTAVLKRWGANFAPHEQATPVMTVRVDAGFIMNAGTLTEIAAQSTGTITAPVSNSRIDRVVVDSSTGAVSVITGAPGASPTTPALTAGKIPVCRVLIPSGTTAITNSMITDERVPYFIYPDAVSSGASGLHSGADKARLANTSGTNTGDQTNISGNAATATNATNASNATTAASCSGNAATASSVAWTGVTGRPTALSQFTNDAGFITAQYVKAWVNFDVSSSSPSIRAALNVSSISDNGVGDFTVIFSSGLADANYAYQVNASPQYPTSAPFGAMLNSDNTANEQAPSSGGCRFAIVGGSGYYDPKYVNVTVCR